MIKRILIVPGLLLSVTILILAVNTVRFQSKQKVFNPTSAPEISNQSLAHMQEAITIKTISYDDSTLIDTTQFYAFRKFLENSYPQVHSRLTREIFNKFTLIYKWEGKDLSKNPIILMAHQDVVPIEESSRQSWTVNPFKGTVKDDFIWGRGTADDKTNLISILEAAEKLLTENFKPSRTVYFVFGHDEEIKGKGAKAAAQWFKSNKINADLVLDEGGILTKTQIPGITEKTVALLGTSEKGYLSVKLSVQANGGHSSMPAKETALDILMNAVVKIREKPFKPELSQSTQGFIEYIGPEMPWFQKVVFANQWLFSAVITRIYEKFPAGNAMIRTTTVPTVIHSGSKENVVPSFASVVMNIRMLPGNSSTSVLNKLNEIVSDARVSITPIQPYFEATNVTSPHGYGFLKVDESIKKSYPNVISAPFLMIGATDSRYFDEISENIIKFSPMIDPVGYHGIDEHVSLKSFQIDLWFYENLFRALN